MERRTFIKLASLTSMGGLIKQGTLQAQTRKIIQVTNAFEHDHIPKKLTFNPSKLKGLSQILITSHLDNNYGGSVKALNVIRKKLNEVRKDKNSPPYVYNDLKREHLLRTGSVVNHELYFDNLGGNGKTSGTAQKLISQAYGSFDAWEEEFRKIAHGLAGGPGWVTLGYNHQLEILENYWSNDHMHGIFATTPLLVMDMYEHSYHIDYGAAASKYIDAFFVNINWEVVNQRMETLSY
ncbi:MAG: Fe-Mn family superoxide dismutase [Bacteriovoracaceae bacterium]|nr:Fe-Mn family superoxide dismutase [Bacteriovoracaceae bacterium]